MKIKPCPWCNSPAKIYKYKSTDDAKYFYQIRCINKSCLAKSTCRVRPRSWAIESWNGGPNYKYRDCVKTLC